MLNFVTWDITEYVAGTYVTTYYHAYIDYTGNVNLSKTVRNGSEIVKFKNSGVRCIQLIEWDSVVFALFSNGIVESLYKKFNNSHNFYFECTEIESNIIKIGFLSNRVCMLSTSGIITLDEKTIFEDATILDMSILNDVLILHHSNKSVKLYHVHLFYGEKYPEHHDPIHTFDTILTENEGVIKTICIVSNIIVIMLDCGTIISSHRFIEFKKTDYYTIIEICDDDTIYFFSIWNDRIELLCIHYSLGSIVDIYKYLTDYTIETCCDASTLSYSHISYLTLPIMYLCKSKFLDVLIMIDGTIRTFKRVDENKTTEGIEIFDIFEEYTPISNSISGSYI